VFTSSCQPGTLTAVADAPTATELLWPDPRSGPWLIRIWWRVQFGVPTPVGLSLTSWVEPEDEAWAGPHNYLPRGTDEVALPRVEKRLLQQLPMTQLLEATLAGVRQGEADRAEHLHTWLRLAEAGDPLASTVDPAVSVADVAAGVPARIAQAEDRAERLANPRGVDLGDDFYRQVAAVYAAAIASGRPTAAVAEHLEVKQHSAAKYVHRARQRGFLPKTTRGRVGPVTEEL
jgi:hypothetical protein